MIFCIMQRNSITIPKRVLIKIATKKREKSMLAAYLKYKASLSPRKKMQTVVKVSKALSPNVFLSLFT
jgi:hypothetical protein